MTFSQEKRNVVLGVTGSIAAYKSAELARLLVTRGYSVRVIMSNAAQEFIGPVTLESITGHPVLTGFWEEAEKEGIEHIELASWADTVVIAPATADTLAKAAAGFADSPLLAVVLATRAPVVVAPAMNCNMYENVKTQENLRQLRERGVHVVEPEAGMLACGWRGTGRLADPWEIYSEVRKALSRQDFAGKHVVITTGSTREPIDASSYISSATTGKMGVELAREAFRRGADVALIHGYATIKVPRAVRRIEVETAEEMQTAAIEHIFDPVRPADVAITASVAVGYRAAAAVPRKLSRGEAAKIELTPTGDLLEVLGEKRAAGGLPLLIGFATETGEVEDLLREARERVREQRLDLLVGRFCAEAGEVDSNEVVWLVDRAGKENQVATSYKSRVANQILDAVSRLL